MNPELKAALILALEALYASKPIASRYPEPMERHNKAIRELEKQLLVVIRKDVVVKEVTEEFVNTKTKQKFTLSQN